MRDLSLPISTNMGTMPLVDYLDILATQHGYKNIEDALQKGVRFPGYEDVTEETYKLWEQGVLFKSECRYAAEKMLWNSMPLDDAQKILDHEVQDGKTVFDLIVDDVRAASSYETDGNWNDDDVLLAIGRVFKKIINVEG